MRHHTRDSAWSLGAVLAEREVDDRTWLLVVRPDVAPGAAIALGRRLLGLSLAGYSTIVVDLADGERITGALLAVLAHTRRKIERRGGRLAVVAGTADARSALTRAGLEVAEL